MKTILISVILLLSALSVSAQDATDEIKQILMRQQQCWNQGDLNCFMNGYWESEDLKFVGKSGVTKGWQATLDRYKKAYPDRKTMGKLTFSQLKMQQIAGKTALVIGNWKLEREEDDLEGWFSLVWKKMKGKWVIIADHSS